MITGLLRNIALAACAVGLAGCKIAVDLPEQFLVTRESGSEFKATTADDAIFWVRLYSLPADGDKLEFWVNALKNDFVDNRGYVLIGEEAARTKAGREAAQLVFETTTQGRAFRYLVNLTVEPGGLFSNPVACVATFTAEKAAFAERVAGVKQAMLTIRD